ncbi:phospholipase effector Tle1 domain-containing protein [Luteimonas sp. A534]
MDQHRISPDGVQARALGKEELDLIDAARAGMWRVRAPVFLDSADDRVFFVAMDGTSNSREKDPPENHTVVAKFEEALAARDHPAIGTTYIAGVGTQDGFLARSFDGAKAVTLDARAEKAYYDLCVQVKAWRDENPDAKIHVAGTGFSRGAESFPILARMIHERGIRDPTGVRPTFNEDGVLTSISWPDQPLLDPPGSIPTAAFLIDPVGTGRYDTERKLPASNVGLVQLTSWLEPRDHFSSTQHAPLGLSDQGRVANFAIAGAHSDLGGSYHIDGVGRVVYNLQVDYFSTVLGGLQLEKVPEASDPRMYVAHRSEQHLLGLWPDYGYQAVGGRIMHQKLGPSCRQVASPDQCLREPVDPRLADGLTYKHVEVSRHPGGTDAKMETAMAALDAMYKREPGLIDSAVTHTRIPMRAQALARINDFDLDTAFQQLATSAMRHDAVGMRVATRLYAATPLGMVMQAGGAAERLTRMITERRTQEEAAEATLEHEGSAPVQPHAQPPAMGL